MRCSHDLLDDRLSLGRLVAPHPMVKKLMNPAVARLGSLQKGDCQTPDATKSLVSVAPDSKFPVAPDPKFVFVVLEMD